MSYTWHSPVCLLRLLLLFDLVLRYRLADGEPLSPRSIRTKYGVVRGVLRHYAKANVSEQPSWPLPRLPERFSVEIYRSVPFAQPPVANLRFLPPVTQQRWRGTKLANRFHSVCMQNTAEIASSDLSSASPSTTPANNKDAKGQHHEHSPTTLSSVSSVYNSSSHVSSHVSSGVSDALSFKSPNASSVSSANQNLKRTARTKREVASSAKSSGGRSVSANDGSRSNGSRGANKSTNGDKSQLQSSYKLNSSSNSTLIDRRPARSTVEDVDGQFDRQFISNLLRIHPAYFRPFASYIRNQNEDCLTLNIYVPYDGKS